MQIYFNPKLIFTRNEYWRLVTSFCYFGNLNISFLFHMLFVYRYCKMLEEESYRGRTADFILLFIFSGFLTIIAGLITHSPFLGQSFTQIFVYIWSRRNPFSLLSVFGFIIRAPYLPYVFMLFSLVLGGEVMSDLVGIIVGHLYYFIEDVFPHQEGGFRILHTPDFLKRIFNENYHEEREQRERELDTTTPAPPPEELPENNNPGGYDFGANDEN